MCVRRTAAVLCLLTLGCGATPAVRDSNPPLPAVRFRDPDLATLLRATPRMGSTEDHRLRAIVRFLNPGDTPIRIELRALYEDRAGRVLNPEAEWHSILLPENGLYVHDVATTEYEATAFVVEVRRGRDE